MKSIELRNMKRHEMQIAIEWAKKEGWNPGQNDKDCFYNADPNGFFVGLYDGKIAAIISAIKYGLTYGFIGFYIVDPDYRGKRFGIQIWNLAVEYLQGRLVGLDGVPAQISNYEKSGFVLAHRNITFKGIATQRKIDSSGMVELTVNDLDIVKPYDRLFFPDEREDFLKCWISQPESHVLGFMANGALKGYGKIRRCPEAYKIGPVFANDSIIAERLITTLQNKIPEGSEFTIDIPEVNKASMDIANNFEMKYSFETARMYKNGSPNIDLNKVFGITSYELG